jgi:hypothetical protein
MSTSLFRAAPGDQLRDAVRFVLELGACVHGEDDGGHVQFAVDLGNAVKGRGAVLGLEVLRGGFGERLRQRAVAAIVHLEVDVHVDRVELRGVDAQFVAHVSSL